VTQPRGRAGLKRAFGLLARRPELIRRDADDELAALLEERVDHFIARGMNPEAARAEAVRRMGGDMEAAREGVRESAARRERAVGLRESFGGVRDDLWYALRGFAREPLFTSFAVLTLALGIGANAAMFGIVDRLLLRGPAHVRDPEQVVRLYWRLRQPGGEMSTTAAFDPRVYANLLAESHAFSGLAMETGAQRSTLLGEGPNARLVASARGTSNLMSVLGARPALGRFFSPDEQETDAPPPVVVLGYGLWQTDFGGDSSIIGRSIPISGRPSTVIGVAPKAFTGAALERVDVWLPLPARTGPAARRWGPGSSSGPTIVARLRPGSSADAAAIDATRAYRQTYDGGEARFAEGSITAAPLRFGPDGAEAPEARISRWLAGVAAVVLLLACTNLVNLLSARAVRRSREMAIRRALGAGRGRLARLIFTSSLLLVTAGGVVGLLVASAISTLVQRILLPDVDWPTGVVDGRMLLFSLLAVIICTLVIGLVPALRAGRIDVVSALKAGAREGGGRRAGVRLALLTGQAALAMLLLVGAGLFVRSLDRVRHLDLGVDAAHVIVLSPRWPRVSGQESEAEQARQARRRERFAVDALERLTSMPEVAHAAAAVGIPFGNAYAVGLRLPGRDSLPRVAGGFGDPDVSAVSSDYFSTVGTHLLRGRLFRTTDRAGSEPVAIVSATMARVLWPGADALQQCLLVDASTTCTRVVGIVQDARRGRLREDPIMHYYLPLGQDPQLTGPELLVRPHGRPERAILALRSELRRLEPSLLFVDAETLQQRIEPQARTWSTGALTFTLFAVLALIVAAVGTFSVVAYAVEQRRHEIGVRMALGARTAQVVRLLLRGTLGATLGGVVIGGGIALFFGPLAEPLLFETSPHDPMVLGAVGGMLLLVAGVASVIPALRARHVDPLRELRED
jgi:predicted permease